MMALSNAERQRRWRAKRNRLAKRAMTISGLIAALVDSVRGKTAVEIDKVSREVQRRLDKVRERAKRE